MADRTEEDNGLFKNDIKYLFENVFNVMCQK